MEIPTPEGWKNILDIEIGSTIFDENGQLCQVIKTWPIEPSLRCFNVLFDDGTVVTVDANHRWAAWNCRAKHAYRHSGRYRSEGDPYYPLNWAAWKSRRISAGIGCLHYTTEEMAATLVGCGAHTWNYSIPATKAVVTPSTHLPLDPYVLGYMLGDAAASGNGHTACDERDKKWLITQFLERGSDATDYGGKTYFGVRGVSKTWTMLGLQRKHIPHQYMWADKNQRLQLAKGLIDSDGSVNGHGSYSFSNLDPILVEDTIHLLSSLGCIVRVYINDNQTTPAGNSRRTSYQLTIAPTMQLALLPRKADKTTPHWGRGQGEARYITAISPTSSISVKRIRVNSPSNLYLCTRSFIPTCGY